MKDVFLLTKILLKSSFNNNSKKSKLVRFLGFGLVYLYIAVIIGYISYEAISALKTVGQEAVFINLWIVSMVSFIIMRAIFTSINVLFFSKDIEFLLPLPIKPYKIVMAKLNYLIISEYFMCGVILLPALLVYGFLMNLNLWFYILSILIILFLPVIPVVLVSLLLTIVMRFTNFLRNKDIVQYITIVLTLLLVLGIQGLTTTDNQITQDQLVDALIKTNGLVEVYTQYFVTLKPVMNSILNYNTSYGMGQLLIFAAESIFIYAIVIFVASKFYISTVVNTTSSKKRINGEKNLKEKIFKEESYSKAYIKKEWKILMRNPIFFMQCVMPSILFPLFVLVTVFMSFKEMGISEGANNPFNAGLVESSLGASICLAIMIFAFMFNFVSITGVSRDGKQAVFMKYVPIKLQKQCLYKIMPGVILNLFPIVYTLIALKLLVPDVSLIFIAELAVIAILFNIFNNYIMIMIDLRQPKLEWLTEYAVVKQNFNMVYEFGIYIIEAIAVGILGAFIQNKEILLLIFAAIGIILIWQIQNYISKNEKKLFDQII